MNNKENYTPAAGQYDIILSNTQQTALSSDDLKYMVIYVNGLRMDEGDDYTYNNTNYTVTFTEAFDGGEKVTVVLSHFEDSATDKALYATSDKYEKPYERTKVYSSLTGSASITLDINNYNLFVLDLRTSIPNTISVSLPNCSGAAIGKSVMISVLIGSSLPTFTWGGNVIWNTSDTTAPTFQTGKSYNISLFQVNSVVKYIGNVNSVFDTNSLIIT